MLRGKEWVKENIMINVEKDVRARWLWWKKLHRNQWDILGDCWEPGSPREEFSISLGGRFSANDAWWQKFTHQKLGWHWGWSFFSGRSIRNNLKVGRMSLCTDSFPRKRILFFKHFARAHDETITQSRTSVTVLCHMIQIFKE